MKVLYMGTAAEERIPGMFCNCELCQKSLKLGGKNIRTRAQALIDDTLLIDFGSDTYDHFIKAGRTLWDIQNVLLTHSHPDHLTLEVFSARNHWASAETCKYPTIKVYTSAGVIEKIWRVVEARGLEKELIEKFWEFIPMNYYESFKIDDFTITPFPANHAKGVQAYIFLIEKDGKTMFYGNDTGKAIADYLCIHDEVVDDSRDMEIFDPDATWKRKNVYNFEAKELQVPIFKDGKLVYELPNLEQIRSYCAQQVDTLWEEVKRFDNPQTYYVDLSQNPWDIKYGLLKKNAK